METIQRKVLENENNTNHRTYTDDIVVFGNTNEENLDLLTKQNVIERFERLRK